MKTISSTLEFLMDSFLKHSHSPYSITSGPIFFFLNEKSRKLINLFLNSGTFQLSSLVHERLLCFIYLCIFFHNAAFSFILTCSYSHFCYNACFVLVILFQCQSHREQFEHNTNFTLCIIPSRKNTT